MAEDTVQGIRERLARIETLLENMTENNGLKNSNLDEKIKVANHRIQDLEDNSKWYFIGGVVNGNPSSTVDILTLQERR